MRNYSAKSNKRVVRYRTPSSFLVRKAESVKRQASPPYHPPKRGKRSSAPGRP